MKDQDTLYFKQLEIAEEHRVCWYCQNRLAKTKDHIIPVGRGGAKRIENLIKTCGLCNNMKRDLMPEEFLKELSVMMEQTQKMIDYAKQNRVIMMTEQHKNRIWPPIGINVLEYINPLA